MPKALEELTAELIRLIFTSENDDGSRFVIALVRDPDNVEHKCQGVDTRNDLVPGLTYRFLGHAESHAKYGDSFAFKGFANHEPASRVALTKYLQRYAPGIGPTLAGRLFDAYGGDAVKTLRTDPDRAASEIKALNIEIARHAAMCLEREVKLEQTKIALTSLFAGRGFPWKLVDETIAKWGVLAPERIQRDPFTLLVHDFAGCGFERCDRMYLDLGLNPARLKRQVICAWWGLHNDSSGHTWQSFKFLEMTVKRLMSLAKVDVARAVKLGVRSSWLAVKKVDGVWWVAEAERAEAEESLAERLEVLCGNEIYGTTQSPVRETVPEEVVSQIS